MKLKPVKMLIKLADAVVQFRFSNVTFHVSK